MTKEILCESRFAVLTSTCTFHMAQTERTAFEVNLHVGSVEKIKGNIIPICTATNCTAY
jgi:hypothetical protein